MQRMNGRRETGLGFPEEAGGVRVMVLVQGGRLSLVIIRQ